MLRRVLPLLIVLLGVAGFIALKATRPKPVAATPQERVWRVETEIVSPGPHRPVLALFGRVEAPDRVRASAPVAGRLMKVLVRDGERVPAGTLLAQMDPQDLEPRLAQARAEVAREQLKLAHDQQSLEQERALLALAQTALGRADKVQSQRLGTAADVDQASEQLARARLAVTLREQAIAEHPSRLAVLQAKLAEAERDAARGKIVAPYPARIGVVEAAAGDQLQPNQTILTLYPHDGLYLRAKIPGDRSEELRVALAAGETLTARARHAGRTFGATLDRIAGEADARGVDALLRLEPDADLPLGAFVDLTLERPVAADTLALPFAALNGGERIYVVVDGRLQAVPIERVGELEQDGVSKVLVRPQGWGSPREAGADKGRAQGLGAGMRVMVTHLPNAVDGLKVDEVGESQGLAQGAVASQVETRP